MVLLRHFDDCNTARFVTLACYRGYKLFEAEFTCGTFLRHLHEWTRDNDIGLLGYVIMPNHVHLVLYTRTELEMGRVIGRLKSVFAYKMLAGWKREKSPRLDRLIVRRGGKTKHAFWETRCHDHNCRTANSVRTKIRYCHMNPVRAGLVSTPEEWRWSSYRWYSDE